MLKLWGKIKCLLGFHDNMYIMYTPDEYFICCRCGKEIR